MNWTVRGKLEYLRTLPWTILVSEEDGETVLRVAELPGVLASGVEESEIEADFFGSLEAAFLSYLQDGETIPLPSGSAPLPWIAPDSRFEVQRVRVYTTKLASPEVPEPTTGSSQLLSV